MKNILVICNSHLYIPATLTLILSNGDKKFVIYTDNTSIETFFQRSELDIKVILEPRWLTLRHPINIMEFKNNIIRNVNRYHVNEILFFHDGECMPANWMLKKLKDKVPITHIPILNDNVKPHKKYDLKQLISIISNYIAWGIKVTPIYGFNNYLTPYLDESFFRKLNCSRLLVDVDYGLIARNLDIISPLFKEKRSEILWLQSEMVGGSISQADYISVIDMIIEHIGFNNLMYKAKPNFENSFGLEKQLQSVPSYISANLIVNKFRAVIGTNSATLAESAEKGIPTFSILNLFHYNNENDKDLAIKYLNSLSKRIIYPRSIQELIELINSI